MNLTEPHCGTDLGLLRTKAVPPRDGSYKITGTKIFISAGEHDLAENIVHLVLARIEGAPAGTKGISLFIVPKFLPGADGALGPRNGVSCGSIEEKMGIHGNATCVMNYDGADRLADRRGEPRACNAMFVMMNEARLRCRRAGPGDVGGRLSERRRLCQGPPAGPLAIGAQVPRQAGRPDHRASRRAAHPDDDQGLQRGRARARAVDGAQAATSLHRSPDDKERQAADDHMGLLTPVIKGVLTDQGFANAVMAQQVFGGHGYIAEHGMEQFVRDARIAMIYEGANGIQALDLVGRKLGRDGGRAVMAFFNEVQGFIKENGDEAMKPYVAPLGRSARRICSRPPCGSCRTRMGKPDNAGAGSNDYMHLFGLVALGYMWAHMVKAAQEKLATGADDAGEGMAER